MNEHSGGRLRHFIREGLKNIYWDIHGGAIENPELPRNPKSLLFVCKGNICRSPFAEWLSREIAGSKGLTGMVFSSGGIEVSGHFPPPEEAVRAAADFGVYHGAHRSKGITYDMMKASDMVLAMEAAHLKVLRGIFPQFYYRIFLLPVFGTCTGRLRGGYSFYNISDPYGGSPEQFRACYQRIEECLSGLFPRIGREMPEPDTFGKGIRKAGVFGHMSP